MTFQPARLTRNWEFASNIFSSSVVSLPRNERLVSFSLFNNIPIYSRGAVENARLMEKIYPGWTMYVYHGLEVDADILKALRDLSCVTVLCSHVIGRPPERLNGKSLCGKFWRFMALAEPGVELAIFRDCDSRINVREQAAVKEWIGSGKALHTMTEKARQKNRPIKAGMWGCRANRFDIVFALKSHEYTGKYEDDELFLGRTVWPALKDDSINHGKDRPFPIHSKFNGFVGEKKSPETSS